MPCRPNPVPLDIVNPCAFLQRSAGFVAEGHLYDTCCRPLRWTAAPICSLRRAEPENPRTFYSGANGLASGCILSMGISRFCSSGMGSCGCAVPLGAARRTEAPISRRRLARFAFLNAPGKTVFAACVRRKPCGSCFCRWQCLKIRHIWTLIFG